MKIFNLILLFLVPIFCSLAKANTPTKTVDSLAQWLNTTYEVSASGLAAYRYSLEKTDPKRIKLEDEKNKTLLQTSVEKKLAKELEVQFSPAEITYLKKLFDHNLMQRFEVFRKKMVNPYALVALAEVVEPKLNIKATSNQAPNTPPLKR